MSAARTHVFVFLSTLPSAELEAYVSKGEMPMCTELTFPVNALAASPANATYLWAEYSGYERQIFEWKMTFTPPAAWNIHFHCVFAFYFLASV